MIVLLLYLLQQAPCELLGLADQWSDEVFGNEFRGSLLHRLLAIVDHRQHVFEPGVVELLAGKRIFSKGQTAHSATASISKLNGPGSISRWTKSFVLSKS